jgi:transcriptional regulator with XRE-family HTH domain
MGITLEEKLKQLPLEQQKKIKERTEELIAEEMRRSELRKAFKLTQKRLGQILKLDQANVSRLEQRTDLMLSTLREYVTAMGGELELVAKFPDRPPVKLVGISELEEFEDISVKRSKRVGVQAKKKPQTKRSPSKQVTSRSKN